MRPGGVRGPIGNCRTAIARERTIHGTTQEGTMPEKFEHGLMVSPNPAVRQIGVVAQTVTDTDQYIGRRGSQKDREPEDMTGQREAQVEELIDDLLMELEQSKAWTKHFPLAVSGDSSPAAWAQVRSALTKACWEWAEANDKQPAGTKQVYDALQDLVYDHQRSRITYEYPGYIDIVVSPYLVFGFWDYDGDWNCHVKRRDPDSREVGETIDVFPLDFQGIRPYDARRVARRIMDRMGWNIDV